MKKRIKLLPLLLTVALLSVSVVGCDNGINETPTDAPSEVRTEVPTEAPTEVPTEAPTEAETEHTEHIGAGKCDVCGIDYYEIVVDYIKAHGEKNGKFYDLIYKNGDDEYIIRFDDNEDNKEICLIKYLGKEYQWFDGDRYIVQLTLTKSGIKYGEYTWGSYYSEPNYGVSGGVSGKWSPNTITPDTEIFFDKSSTDLSEDKTETANNQANRHGRILINEIFIPFLKEVGQNLTPSDFGFVRFED